MEQSYYDSSSRIIHRRAAGYDKNADDFTNAAYLSMTQPYAAGALASSVDDLTLWDTALYTEKINSQETLQKAFNSYKLMEGTSTMYGFGWSISDYGGHQFIGHSGGIPGFSTYAIRIPDDRIFIAVLSNKGGSHPGLLAFKIAALTIGKPYNDPKPVELQSEVLALYEGIYEISSSERLHITREDNQLFYQYGENLRRELVPLSNNEFFFEENSTDHLLFVRDANNVIAELELRGRVGIPEIAKRVENSTSNLASQE